MEVKPAQQPKALATIRNKYPAKPTIPNKRAKFANTNFITINLKSLCYKDTEPVLKICTNIDDIRYVTS